MLLHGNDIRNDLSALCHWVDVRSIYLHENQLAAQIPDCLGDLASLEVLTLHANSLVGHIPSSLGTMSSLKVLTLHENILTGSIPKTFSRSPQLSFFSAFRNDLSGTIPELNLQQGCADDMSFEFEKVIFSRYDFDVRITCDHRDQDLEHLNLSFAEMESIYQSCPNEYNQGNCSKSSSRGPVLLLQGNRLSCSLPTKVTSALAEELRSLILMGNMLGNGTEQLPDWVHDTENQPFLYVSSFRGEKVLMMFLGLGTIFSVTWCSLGNCSGYIRRLQKEKDQIGRAHAFVMQMNLQLLPVYSLLLALYLGGSSFYECGDLFGDATLAHFAGADMFLALCWFIWDIAGLRFLRDVPKPPKESISARKEPSFSGFWSKMFWCSLWLCIVALLSFPSMAYTMVNSLPRQNTLLTNPQLLMAIHSLAVPIMLLIVPQLQKKKPEPLIKPFLDKRLFSPEDMMLTPILAQLISIRSGLRGLGCCVPEDWKRLENCERHRQFVFQRSTIFVGTQMAWHHSFSGRSMLLMAARSATMWLNATLCTVYLSERCIRGWTQFLAVKLDELQHLQPCNCDTCPRFWTVCQESTEDYQNLNISLGDHQLLNPTSDLCILSRKGVKLENLTIDVFTYVLTGLRGTDLFVALFCWFLYVSH